MYIFHTYIYIYFLNVYIYIYIHIYIYYLLYVYIYIHTNIIRIWVRNRHVQQNEFHCNCENLEQWCIPSVHRKAIESPVAKFDIKGLTFLRRCPTASALVKSNWGAIVGHVKFCDKNMNYLNAVFRYLSWSSHWGFHDVMCVTFCCGKFK